MPSYLDENKNTSEPTTGIGRFWSALTSGGATSVGVVGAISGAIVGIVALLSKKNSQVNFGGSSLSTGQGSSFDLSILLKSPWLWVSVTLICGLVFFRKKIFGG